ncbi:hypothetical protein DH2020_043493 [Rehmannia glutinosa]|uniref:Serine carboxypeptidase-like protein n=1 Tax=Rehmannia glutinosa TaxID=99300 RepID=A0ABR0UKP2_REHGL
MFSEDGWFDILLPSKQLENTLCHDHMNYFISYAWANNPEVQDALYVRKGTIKEWKKCNKSILYEYNVESVVSYHQLLSEKKYKALVYSGDHDITVPYLATLKWIQQLNLSVIDDWRPWYVNRQVAGYTQRYNRNEFSLTFATIKGAGHTAPEYNPEQCYAMVDRWFSSYPL